MFSIALIVFREVFEISLIVSILMVATKGLAKRTQWVGIGILLGIAGAILIAFFADFISQAASGMGQEMLNATILLIAAALIGWTTLWMNHHGRELAQHFKEVGKSVIKGQKPMYTLAVVVALSALREGSEIVMFTYSALMTGGKAHQLVLGGLLGTSGGIAMGMILYYGLMKIPTKKIFTVTSWLLIFLVAGMVAQAFGYLTVAGKVPEIIPTVWDTSKIVAENSFLGKIMHVLVGYTDRPSGVQILVYLLTIGGLATILKIYGQSTTRHIKNHITFVIIGLAFSFGLSQPAYAEKYVYSPIVYKGEWEIETKGLYDFDHRKNKNAVQEYKNAIGYGVTDRWATELYGEHERQPQEDENGNTKFSRLKFTHMEWENRYQLTEQGQYWVDAGLYFAYEIPLQEKDPGKIEGKILLEKSLPHFIHTANIIFNKEVGGGTTHETQGGFAWSSKYRLSKYFEPGFEYYIDFGEINEHLPYDEQSHQVGPAFYGRLTKNIKYNVGYLFGISRASPDGELKWVLEYELRF